VCGFLFRHHAGQQGRSGHGLLAGQRKGILARHRDGVPLRDIEAVIRWALTSPHERARYLRDGGYTKGETLFRPANFDAYLAIAEQPTAGSYAPSSGGEATTAGGTYIPEARHGDLPEIEDPF
jgi:hypothetical protein